MSSSSDGGGNSSGIPESTSGRTDLNQEDIFLLLRSFRVEKKNNETNDSMSWDKFESESGPDRTARAARILQSKGVKHEGRAQFVVTSESSQKYHVDLKERKCDCSDFGVTPACKHIIAVEAFVEGLDPLKCTASKRETVFAAAAAATQSQPPPPTPVLSKPVRRLRVDEDEETEEEEEGFTEEEEDGDEDEEEDEDRYYHRR